MRVLGVHVSVQSGDRQGEMRREDRREKRKEKREKREEKREKDKRDGRKMIEVRWWSEKDQVYEDSKRLGSDSSRFNTCIDGQLCGKRCI